MECIMINIEFNLLEQNVTKKFSVSLLTSNVCVTGGEL